MRGIPLCVIELGFSGQADGANWAQLATTQDYSCVVAKYFPKPAECVGNCSYRSAPCCRRIDAIPACWRRSAHASGVAHGSASGSIGSAPRASSSLTSSTRPQRHAHPRGVLLQEFVPDVRARPRIQQDGRQRHAHSMVSRDHFVQHRLSRFPCPKIGIAALENQSKRLAAVRLFGVVQVLVPGQRTPQRPEPSRVVPRPVDPLQRHAHDVRAPPARAAPQDLFGDRLTRECAELQVWIELARKHAACDLHFAQVSDRGRVDPTAVFQHEVDHRRVRCVPAWRTAAVCRKSWRARCQHLGVRIGAVLEQHAAPSRSVRC